MKNKIELLLKTKNTRITNFRKNVLAILMSKKRAIPVSFIEKSLVNYDRITLYRTLKLFKNKGIIHEIMDNNKNSCYAICEESCGESHQHKHIHFECSECNVVLCLDIEKFPDIKLKNYTIKNIEIQAMGICEKCNKT